MDRTIAIGYQERLFKLILAFKENKYCADCQSLNPDWASTTLGVFVCYKCSGNHRSFGLHITRVKSATLDTWTLKQVYVMGFIDNKISNAYWEANMPDDFIKPTYDSAPNDLANFAKKKYVERAFVVQGQESPAEEIRSNLISTAGASEDKEEFFNTKLEELKKLLKEKVLASSPEKVAPKNRTPKKAGTIVIRPERVSDISFRRFGSPQKDSIQALVSPLIPFGQKINRDPFQFETGSPGLAPSSDLPLFQGLNIKTITTIDEELDETMPRTRFQRPFLKANTQEFNIKRSPEPKSGLVSSAASKNNLMTIPSKRRIIDYLEEEEIFEESKGPTPRCSIEEIELHDLSSISSTQENKGPLLARTGTMRDPDGLIKPYPIKSKTSEGGNYDAHIKRPSEEFSVPKCLSMQEIPPTRLGRVDRLWKYPVLLVCFLLHFAMGYMYCWGSISPYIASFVMNDYSDDRYTEHTNHNMMIFIGIAMGFCLCENIAQSIGMRTLVFVSFLGLGGSILICSLTQDVLLYSGMLTIVAGFFIGLLYEIPFYCSSQYFYSHPVFLKGLFYLANSIGAFGYIYFGYYYLKQGDVDRELELPATSTDSFYSTNLVSPVPDLLTKIGIGLIATGIVGAVLLQPRSSFIIKDYSGYRDHEESLLNVSKRSSTRGRMRRKAPAIIHQGLKEALISPSTKTLLSIIILYSILGSYMLCSYKYLGLLHHYSDAIMSLVGGAGIVLLGIGKVTGVIIHPKYEFKLMCKKIITCQIVAGLGLFLLGQVVDLAFLALFLVIMFFDGLMFSVIIEETKFVHLEDIEDTMVALMILGYGVANFFSFLIVKLLIELKLRSAIILVLTMPIFYAYKKCREYSRATSGDDSEMIADLLDVSQQSLELKLL